MDNIVMCIYTEDSSVLKEVLVNEAKLRGLATSGKKIELLQRLREYSSRLGLGLGLGLG